MGRSPAAAAVIALALHAGGLSWLGDHKPVVVGGPQTFETETESETETVAVQFVPWHPPDSLMTPQIEQIGTSVPRHPRQQTVRVRPAVVEENFQKQGRNIENRCYDNYLRGLEAEQTSGEAPCPVCKTMAKIRVKNRARTI
ncbi:MAG: hypothetical protein GY811_14480 [Myxococcales bacterium]|nr:hypothetical protein [Myxococcales bacterium]